MENGIYTLIGILITFFGVSYFQNKGAEKIEKKTKASNSRINNLSVTALVNLANSILKGRDSSNK